MKALSRNKKKKVSRDGKCVKLHWSFTTVSLRLGGVDSECGERGFDPTVETKNKLLGSTLMVSIYTPSQSLPN